MSMEMVREVLADELRERGWSLESLEDQSGVGRHLWEEVLAGSRRLTAITVHGLARAFGTSDEFWVRLRDAAAPAPTPKETP